MSHPAPATPAKRTVKITSPSPAELRVMALAMAAWNGAHVTMSVEEWERAEQLLEGTFAN